MSDPAQSVIDRALEGEERAREQLVQLLTPVIKARAIRALARSRPNARDPRQEVEDLTQEVFAALFREDGRVLRTWHPERGLSLKNFVGLVAQRQVGAILRSGRRTPWPDEPMETNVMEHLSGSASPPDVALSAREQGQHALDILRESLSPLGLCMFHSLLVEQQDVRTVASANGMTETAVYGWQTRLKRMARQAWQTASEADSGAVAPVAGGGE